MLQMASRYADAIWIGLDQSAESIAQLRDAAGTRPIKIVAGDHPPIGSQLSASLNTAIQRDSNGDQSVIASAKRDLDEWAEMVRHHRTNIDELLIVSWETSVKSMIHVIRSVKEALA